MRTDSERCPFCDADLANATLDVVPELGARRLSRAALFAFATTVAAAACNSPQRPDNGGSGNIVQPYGAPPNPQPPPLPRPTDAGAADPGLVVAVYGAPMPMLDAGAPDARPTDTGAPDVAVDTGRPPRPSRPPPGPGGGPPMVRYGAPPPPDDFV